MKNIQLYAQYAEETYELDNKYKYIYIYQQKNVVLLTHVLATL